MSKAMNPHKLDVVSIRLVKDAPLYSGHPIKKPLDAVTLVGEQLCEMDREVLCVINLCSDGKPINCSFVSVGTVNESMAHPREIFKSSILSNAASMLIVHNHPSGNLTPSKNDTMITDRMVKMCSYMGIPLEDHIIVGGDNTSYFSFKEKNIMPTPKCMVSTDYHDIEFGYSLVAEEGKAR